MTQDIWLNLPVKNLAASVAFFKAIGLVLNPGPGNTEVSASFVVGDKKVVLMLFTDTVFSGFTRNALSSSADGTEVLFSLGVESRQSVDDMADRARSAGGTIFGEPQESNDFMYGCGFCDLDGHRWNVLYMDATKIPR
jgi:predicted lactoylglutathione lyase